VDRNSPSTASRYEALLQLLRTADVIWNTSRLFFQKWDLSPSQFNILNLLDSNPGGLSQSDLGRQLVTHRSNVTGLVDRLEKRGLVARKEVAGDRRAYRVVLTKSGVALLRKILPHYYLKADSVWEGVSKEQISDLLKALDHVAHTAVVVGKSLPPGQNGGSL
jgi:DNA-binding MarR family transcriptional regulator